MARTIIIVGAKQLVTSENNPKGILSDIQGFPQTFDSNLDPFNGDIEKCMKFAKGEFFDRVGKCYKDTNQNRVMMTVTINLANGQKVLDPVCIGGYPADEQETEQEQNGEPQTEPEQNPAE